MGISYIVGDTAEDSFKLDLFYTDAFVFPLLEVEAIRMASTEEIAAMKLDVVQRGGRKKDFWHLHALLDDYTINQMIGFHETRYPYWHDATLIRTNLTDYDLADHDFDPVCLLGKHWEIIKLDIVEIMNGG